MKNLDHYKDIFGPKENLSLSDIESFENASSEDQNSIEQKMEADSFSQDAMEGWEALSYRTNTISALKAKLYPQQTFYWLTAFSALALGVFSVLLVQNLKPTEQQANNNVINQTENSDSLRITAMNIESADIVLPIDIQNMHTAPEQDQLVAETIKVDFAKMENIEMEFTTLDPIVIDQTVENSIISSRVNAKEIYLHDLKLIDYSQYRSKPVVQTKQLSLTGTSADKENQYSETFDSNWEDIDIPYMQYLEKSIYYFNKGRTKKSLARFETILESYKDDVNANFYGALCYYNLGEYRTAIRYFNNCLNSEYSNFDEEAIWITALCYEKMNNANKSFALFEEILIAGGYYSKQASKKLNNR